MLNYQQLLLLTAPAGATLLRACSLVLADGQNTLISQVRNLRLRGEGSAQEQPAQRQAGLLSMGAPTSAPLPSSHLGRGPRKGLGRGVCFSWVLKMEKQRKYSRLEGGP